MYNAYWHNSKQFAEGHLQNEYSEICRKQLNILKRPDYITKRKAHTTIYMHVNAS